MIFNSRLGNKEILAKTVEDCYRKITRLNFVSEQKYIVLEVTAKTLDEQNANFPRIKYLISSN